MTEEQIVHTALENLLEATQLKGQWEKKPQDKLDGTLRIRTGEKVLQFSVEVKKDLRTRFLPQIYEFSEAHQPFMLIADRLYPKIKEELRNHNVSYLEANGNLYLKTPDKWFWIDTNEPLKIDKNVKNRAFTKTGLQVLFDFLRDPTLINRPYRQIAEQTGTSPGNVTHIVKGLIQEGFLTSVSRNEYCFQRTGELLGRWTTAYGQNLKPSLKMGKFRFLDKESFANWKSLTLDAPRTLWGGEPAGAVLTGYLKPAELTLYTEESRSELMKRYRFIPDETGPVQVYRKFWHQQTTYRATVPPLLVYADLIIAQDRRSHETAQKIYNDYLQTELP